MHLDEETVRLILINIGKACAIFLIGYIALRIILFIEKRALHRTGMDQAVFVFVRNGTRIIVYLLILAMILQQLGVSAASMIAVIGAAGAAIALSLKDSLSNVAGGIITIVTKPFKQGDEIELRGAANASGVVDEIDILTTRLHTWDNSLITIPNGMFTTSVLFNYTAAGLRRVDEVIGVGYNSDLNKVKDVIRTVIEQVPLFVPEPEPLIGVASYGDSAILMDVRAWCRYEDMPQARYTLRERLKVAFDEADIEIPYPQMDIHKV